LEQELHVLEEELKNENQLLWEEDEKLYADLVHSSTRGWTTMVDQGYCGTFLIVRSTRPTCCLSEMRNLLKRMTGTEVSTKRVSSVMNTVRQLIPPIEWGTPTPVKPSRLRFRSVAKSITFKASFLQHYLTLGEFASAAFGRSTSTASMDRNHCAKKRDVGKVAPRPN
jgi:hypothetical protein